jgi:hypothetical protein
MTWPLALGSGSGTNVGIYRGPDFDFYASLIYR